MKRTYSLLAMLSLSAVACATATRQPSVPPTNIRWRLIELEGAPAVSAPAGGQAYLELARDTTRVSGFTTCNRFFGRYEAPGEGRIRFTQLGSTKMACVEEDRSRQEARFMEVLQNVDRFTLTDDTLSLYTNNQLRARFVAER